MSALVTTPNVRKPDDVYARLIDAQAGLSDAESLRFNARLILLLINHIGDEAVIAEAINAARK